MNKEYKNDLIEQRNKYKENIYIFNKLEFYLFTISKTTIILAILMPILSILFKLPNFAINSLLGFSIASVFSITFATISNNQKNKNERILTEVDKKIEEVLNNEYISKKKELSNNKEISNEEKIKILKEYKSNIINNNLNNNIETINNNDIKKKVYKPNK